MSDIKVFGIPLGIIIGGLVVIMAACSMLLYFDMIQRSMK